MAPAFSFPPPPPPPPKAASAPGNDARGGHRGRGWHGGDSRGRGDGRGRGSSRGRGPSNFQNANRGRGGPPRGDHSNRARPSGQQQSQPGPSAALKQELRKNAAPKAPAAPGVPMFGGDLLFPPPKRPASPSRPAQEPPAKALKRDEKSQTQTENGNRGHAKKSRSLGLTGRGDDSDSSSSEFDPDEEERLVEKYAAQMRTVKGYRFEHRGQMYVFESPEDIKAFVEDRKRCFPTRERTANRKKDYEELRRAAQVFRRKIAERRDGLHADFEIRLRPPPPPPGRGDREGRVGLRGRDGSSRGRGSRGRGGRGSSRRGRGDARPTGSNAQPMIQPPTPVKEPEPAVLDVHEESNSDEDGTASISTTTSVATSSEDEKSVAESAHPSETSAPSAKPDINSPAKIPPGTPGSKQTPNRNSDPTKSSDPKPAPRFQHPLADESLMNLSLNQLRRQNFCPAFVKDGHCPNGGMCRLRHGRESEREVRYRRAAARSAKGTDLQPKLGVELRGHMSLAQRLRQKEEDDFEEKLLGMVEWLGDNGYLDGDEDGPAGDAD